MTVVVPADKVLLVKLMSGATGIPYNVIACQANLESGFNNGAVSPAGAEGWLQFLPSTFYSVWHGSPFNPVDAANAYVVFMRNLLREFGGNLRDALAAYNAGPGNISAGFGYADTILRCAGSPVTQQANPPGGQLPSDIGPAPVVQADDWSWYISQSSRWVSDTANSLQFYARAIGRL
jgi:soluble lytic murein transglycosylase-like protein